jgi:hypothetical protein
MIQPEELLAEQEPEDLSPLSMAELRAIRERLQEVEFGYSYARRVVQGRLDLVLGMLHSSEDGGDPISGLSEAMAGHLKGPGLPRPTKGLLPPDWADDLLEDLNRTLPPDELGNLAAIPTPALVEAAERISAIEKDLSRTRSQLHTRIERIQGELIARYRGGAGVEDLLS